ncbi:MAG TPA: hypothetical protein VLG39_02295 [Nitrospirota bacterium]|nr:hypothetical protein [Nitrospirota bacterium]
MKARAYGFFYLLITVFAVIAVLKTLNWLPAVLQKDMLSKFGSIEEVRAKLHITDVYMPSYFPESITWPPSEILAQARPYPAVLIIFHDRKTQDAALVISQAASDAFADDSLIPIARITRSVPYDVKNRKALLEVGVCANTEPCSRLSWTENGYRIKLAMKAPPFELIRIAESMLH